MSASQVAMFSEPVEILRWNGTELGIARILTFIAEKGYRVQWNPTNEQPVGAGYEPISTLAGGATMGNFIQYESCGGYRSMQPGEWLAWSPRFGLFEITDSEAARFTDLEDVPEETGYAVERADTRVR